MTVQFKKGKIIESCNIDVAIGSFALDLRPLKFEHCRERFAVSFNSDVCSLYFKHPAGKSIDVASFILKTEEVLGLKFISEFAETNRDTILWIAPSDFWRKCSIRRSLFTIFLRAGNYYDCDKNNYEEALFRQDYVAPTRKAIIRFLFGFTEYTGPEIVPTGTVSYKGWHSVFENKNEAEVKSMLVSPRKSFPVCGDLFPNSLWL